MASIPTLTVTELLEALTGGSIQEQHGLLGWSSNYTSLVSINYHALDLLAVYKPQRGERPLWDFPNGTLCYREVAAFTLSEALAWHIVPPTVIRQGPRGLGSCQLFIHHDPDIHFFSLEEGFTERLHQFFAFDIITNNADRKGGHFILDGQNHLWGIDHGLTFNTAHKLRTVLWDFAGEPIPPAILESLEALHPQLAPGSDLYDRLGDLLTDREIHLTQTRVKRLLHRGQYPQPGPGPNYPWPPV